MPSVYPAPAIVVGVGRFGLALLERLGEDWASLKISGADASIGNLRLLAVRSAAAENGWRRFEEGAVRIAGHLAGSDLPSLALDFAIARALGLVRYRDGCYQVAVPRDAGVVDVDDEQEPDVAAAGSRVSARHSRRLRYFEWLRLDCDPIVAAERLRQRAQQLQEVDLFITPLVNRVRQGHSPQALLACVGRCRALFEGRDPGPWDWTATAVAAESGDVEPITPVIAARDKAEMQLADRFLSKLMAPPLPGWEGWLASADQPPPTIRVLAPFHREQGDLTAPLNPADLLAHEWEVTGWVSQQEGLGKAIFLPLTPHPLQLGLFDLDTRQTVPAENLDLLRRRLRELGGLLHSGLVRLWVDLQRERVGDVDSNVFEGARKRDDVSEALRQSLEVLGEIVVHPLMETLHEVPGRDVSSAAERLLPNEPSRFLRRLELPTRGGESPRTWLERRLETLGFGGGAGEAAATAEDASAAAAASQLLFVDVCLPAEAAGVEELAQERLAPLREALNRQVRDLYDFRFLTDYRQRPTRQPPRLTVYVVGDMSEAFSREVMRHVLRELHAELLRAFTPIFESYRVGFDHCLCVTPILWMPHPADPFEGTKTVVSRCEEAAIIDAIHGIRRWVECVLPAGRRSISQIFVNSRVTDTSTLSLADALRQTRDFVSFQIRNDLSQNEWLRQTSMSAGGADLFASFSCYEIDFPALRSREYLANRLARECLAALKQGEHRRIESPDAPKPPTLEKLTEEARSRLGEVTRRAGNELAQRVEERCRVDRRTPAGLVLRRFDERFEAELVNEVWATWSELTGRLGRVDAAVNDLRLDTSRLVGKALDEVRSFADDAIARYAGEAGLKAVQAALDQLRMKTQEELLLQEKLRRKQEELCDRHRIPALAQLAMARSRVRLAAERKPDLDPIHLGLLVWALLSFVLGAPLAGAVAYLLDLHLRPNWLEWLLGPAGGLTGGLVLWGTAWLVLRWYEGRRFAALRHAIAAMAEQVRSFFWGGGKPPERERSASVRSFLESRLELTGAVATRGFAATVFERVLGDASLVYRLVRSLDIQMGLLERKSESLGVQATMGRGGEKREDLSGLFDSRDRAPADRLIDPDMLHRFFQRRVGDEVSRELASLIEEAGGFTAWREHACLTDSERILRHCRTRFEDLVSEPVANQDFFADTVGQRLVSFVSAVYPNLGFGAGFRGYEGLDPDNVRLIADATLVIHSGLQDLFREAQRSLGQERRVASTLDRLSDGVRPNAAYMLSLVQGIRVHSLRNLRRFESFHNRATMPDDRTFPLTPEPQPPHSAVNPLTGYRDIGSALADDALRFKLPTSDDE